MKKRSKFLILSVLLVLVLVSAFSLLKKEYKLVLIGEENITINVFDEFNEPGVDVFINEDLQEDSNEFVTIESTKLNTDIVGSYEIIYLLDKNNDISVKRIIDVVDTVKPEIKLKEFTETLFVGDEFIDPGYTAHDNYDGDITESVIVDGTVDTKEAGEYKLVYTVLDASKNSIEVERVIIVEKVPVIEPVIPPVNNGGVASGGTASSGSGTTIPNNGQINDTVYNNNYTSSNKRPVGVNHTPSVSKKEYLANEISKDVASNEVYRMKLTNGGITFEGTHDGPISSVSLFNESGSEVTNYGVNLSDKFYSGTVTFDSVPNGTYYLGSNNLSGVKLNSYIESGRAIIKAKIGNKMVTVSYPNNEIYFKVEDHAYAYDIAIDVGHGGTDGGSSGNGFTEKELNLMVSKYERDRFVAHGLKVYLSRETDTYGPLSGDSSWPRARRLAFDFGQKATISRYAYSNHHNSSSNTERSGWEILVTTQATSQDLAVERKVGQLWDGIHNKPVSGPKIYTRDYATDKVHVKNGGENYSFLDYYAMQRTPFILFNEFVSTYEHSFISNQSEMAWYMNEGAWKLMAEAKIKTYVEALGKTYLAP